MPYIVDHNNNIHLIDEIDSDLINFTWHESGYGYAQRCTNNKIEYLHVIILKRMVICPENCQVDHKNLDVKDCRRDNLRVATKAQQQQNTGKKQRRGGTSSRYKGVHYLDSTGKWWSYINVDGIRLTAGYFDTEEAAARKYNENALHYFGEYARLNVIPGDE